MWKYEVETIDNFIIHQYSHLFWLKPSCPYYGWIRLQLIQESWRFFDAKFTPANSVCIYFCEFNRTFTLDIRIQDHRTTLTNKGPSHVTGSKRISADNRLCIFRVITWHKSKIHARHVKIVVFWYTFILRRTENRYQTEKVYREHNETSLKDFVFNLIDEMCTCKQMHSKADRNWKRDSI